MPYHLLLLYHLYIISSVVYLQVGLTKKSALGRQKSKRSIRRNYSQLINKPGTAKVGAARRKGQNVHGKFHFSFKILTFRQKVDLDMFF